ncbi:MAG: hypothetical protein A3H28_01600 [Acidobacteria bacterium RIFCSPLOWO2_02_FULL_61_28]|nr:MAG: hypothetical protein A3H28_01600 [Acidobacteria bacterium RIFCSPLOWO2_02_FULL_61_28]
MFQLARKANARWESIEVVCLRQKYIAILLFLIAEHQPVMIPNQCYWPPWQIALPDYWAKCPATGY